MNLNAEQKSLLASWVAEGLGLAEVQRRLESEFGLRMTYMDVRFLIDDLEIELPEPPKPAPTLEPDPAPAGLEGGLGGPDSPRPDGGVSVDVDRIARPGALVSGSVNFSDGTQARWILDQTGRLALDGVSPDYRPSEEDMIGFQRELQKAMQKMGL